LAIYHCRLKVVSRGCGKNARARGVTRRSVVAAAAYRAGQKLYDATIGQWFSYDRKRNIVHTEIMIPSTAELPKWAGDREAMWNAVEQAEVRVDAQLAREVELTLPRELTQEQQIALVRAYVAENFTGQGMVADVTIHAPKAADGKAQPHAHILLGLRRLDPTTATGFSKNKERDWNEKEAVFREVAEARKLYNRTHAPEDKEALEAAEAKRNINVWRKSWADHVNHALADAGSEARVDHRTLEKQGILRPAQIVLGIARHIEKAYDYIKDRVTQWISIRKRAQFYDDAERIRTRDPTELTHFLLNLNDMAESFAASFRQPPPEPEREVSHDR